MAKQMTAPGKNPIAQSPRVEGIAISMPKPTSPSNSISAPTPELMMDESL